MIPPVVILAGGLATRLYPVTRKIPKSMIEVAGRPFIDHQLSLLKEKGVTRVILCVGQFGQMIEEYVENGRRWGIDVEYSHDGDTLLGTGGAIRNALPLLPDIFIVLYGDSYLDIDLTPVVYQFFEKGLPALMTVYKNRNEFDSSNVLIKEGKIIRYEKNANNPDMEYIDYGLLVIRKDVFNAYPRDSPFDLSLVQSDLVDKGKMAIFVEDNRFHEIGSTHGIEETAEYIMNRGK